MWSITPMLATVIMLLVVTRDGYAKDGWRTLGLHRLGLRVWWIAFFGTLAITVVAYAAVWLTPLASVTVPPQGVLPILGSFLWQLPILATTFVLCEEIGFRGYLLPKLLPLGRKRALLMHFGTARAVKGAALEDLEKAPGISRAMARQLYDYFHPRG